MLTSIKALPVDARHIPFAAAAGRCAFAQRGYCEEEYLFSGTANIYDGYGERMHVEYAEVPYTTRLIVRRPAELARFSGNIVVEILNASAHFDIDRMWVFAREYFMRHGDLYIGITSKQDTQAALQAYDLQRYGALCWDAPFSRALPDAVPQGAMIPLSPAAETGLVWDMLSDLAGLIRSGTQDQPFASYRDAKITLTGWSQSAVYLYRYLGDVVPYIKRMGGKEPYDGYFAAGGPHEMSVPINQQGYYQPEKQAPTGSSAPRFPFLTCRPKASTTGMPIFRPVLPTAMIRRFYIAVMILPGLPMIACRL